MINIMKTNSCQLSNWMDTTSLSLKYSFLRKNNMQMLNWLVADSAFYFRWCLMRYSCALQFFIQIWRYYCIVCAVGKPNWLLTMYTEFHLYSLVWLEVGGGWGSAMTLWPTIPPGLAPGLAFPLFVYLTILSLNATLATGPALCLFYHFIHSYFLWYFLIYQFTFMSFFILY